MVGDTVSFRAVNAEPMFVSFCGSVIQREEEGLWAEADTLSCKGPPPPREAELHEPGAAVLHVTLQPGVFLNVLSAGGPGRFRVVIGARDAGAGPLPDDARASPTFAVDGPDFVEASSAILLGLERLPPAARARYETLTGFRAIAVGARPDGNVVWGYGSRRASKDQAANRALLECAMRAGLSYATCALAAVDGPAPAAVPE